MTCPKRSNISGVGDLPRDTSTANIHWAAKSRKSRTWVLLTQAKVRSNESNRSSSLVSVSSFMPEDYPTWPPKGSWLHAWGLDLLGGLLVGLILGLALMFARVPEGW